MQSLSLSQDEEYNDVSTRLIVKPYGDETNANGTQSSINNTKHQ